MLGPSWRTSAPCRRCASPRRAIPARGSRRRRPISPWWRPGSSGGGKGLAAGTIVAVELAARVDGDADGGLGAPRLEVVPPVLRAEDEVPGAPPDGLRLVLDVPVDLARQHHPPLVVQMVVGVVRMPGGMTDDEGLDVVGEHQRLRP